MAAALFVCGAMTVYAEESDYVEIDKLYSNDGSINRTFALKMRGSSIYLFKDKEKTSAYLFTLPM